MASTVAHYRHGFSRIEVCAGIFIRMSLEHPPEELRTVSASGARAACRCGCCRSAMVGDSACHCLMNSAFFTPLGGQKTSSNRTP